MTDETTLTRRRRLLHMESRILGKLYAVELALGAAALLAGIVVYALRGHPALAIVGGVLLFVGAGHYMKTRQNREEAASLEAGARGEAQTAKTLAESLDNTHYLFNDILLRQGLRTAQIDHLVLCPRGVYVVETKNWRGRIEGHGQEPFWTQVRQPGDAPLRLKSPVIQARRQAAAVAQLLRGTRHPPAEVVPVVAFASTRTDLSVVSPEVPVVHVQDLARAIAARPSARLHPEPEVDEWVGLISRRI